MCDSAALHHLHAMLKLLTGAYTYTIASTRNIYIIRIFDSGLFSPRPARRVSRSRAQPARGTARHDPSPERRPSTVRTGNERSPRAECGRIERSGGAADRRTRPAVSISSSACTSRRVERAQSDRFEAGGRYFARICSTRFASSSLRAGGSSSAAPISSSSASASSPRSAARSSMAT